MHLDAMISTAQELVAPGKGILAADESTPTMAKRLAAIGVESTEERRRSYRQLLAATPGLGEHISGVILFDETARQSRTTGPRCPSCCAARGSSPASRSTGGRRHWLPSPTRWSPRGSTASARGWRSTPRWVCGSPSGGRSSVSARDGRHRSRVEANTHALARYAALAQEAGLVPIVEPEVLMDGAHSLDRCAEVTVAVLRSLYEQLARHRVVLAASLLKPSMVLPGKDGPDRSAPADVAAATIAALREAVPAAVPGIVFLSGGQSDEEATANLDALNRRAPQPWELSFSFGRALQAPVLRAWAGDSGRVQAARAALLHRAALNGAARRGTYTAAMEQPVAVQ